MTDNVGDGRMVPYRHSVWHPMKDQRTVERPRRPSTQFERSYERDTPIVHAQRPRSMQQSLDLSVQWRPLCKHAVYERWLRLFTGRPHSQASVFHSLIRGRFWDTSMQAHVTGILIPRPLPIKGTAVNSDVWHLHIFMLPENAVKGKSWL